MAVVAASISSDRRLMADSCCWSSNANISPYCVSSVRRSAISFSRASVMNMKSLLFFLRMRELELEAARQSEAATLADGIGQLLVDHVLIDAGAGVLFRELGAKERFASLGQDL